MTESITPQAVFAEYERGVAYDQSIHLYETVRRNENFYLGRQWEGVIAPDLEKPVLNLVKRVCTYMVSTLASDDIGVSVEPFHTAGEEDAIGRLLQEEVERVIERTKLKPKTRDAIRNACVDGDCCFFLRFDPDIETGQPMKGEILIDCLDNVNVLFGNPYLPEVQGQPYILVVKRQRVESVRKEAKEQGIPDWEQIAPDRGETGGYDEHGGELCTVLYRFWREEGTIHYLACTRDLLLKAPTDLGYRLYPLAYMSWDRVKNSYRGEAPISSIIPNQIYINKLWAMFMEHQKRAAFPKTFFDRTKISEWSNKVGQAIGVVGNPNEAVVSSQKAGDFSAQAMELVEKTIQYTKEFLGASDAALGNVRPDNTSAIIAVQKSTAAPLELQRLALYQFIEDVVRILVEIMRCDYGIRTVTLTGEGIDPTTGETMEQPQRTMVDFGALPYDAMQLNVEVGSSAYWSELTQMQTADNLFTRGIIQDAATYLESVPDKYVKGKAKILKQLHERQAAPSAAPAGYDHTGNYLMPT